MSNMPTQTATAGAPSTVATASNDHDYVNPQRVTLLNLLGMNVEYERCFGCEFSTPKKLAVRVLYEAFHRVHPAMFGQIIVMRMFREKRILTQICGNNFMVLKARPPLIVTDEQLDEFVQAIRDVVELTDTSPTFWTEALGMARRAVNI